MPVPLAAYSNVQLVHAKTASGPGHPSPTRSHDFDYHDDSDRLGVGAASNFCVTGTGAQVQVKIGLTSNDHDSGSQPEARSCSWTPGPTRTRSLNLNTPVGPCGSSLPPSHWQAQAVTVPPSELEAETASPQVVGLGGYLDSESESTGRPGLGCAPCHGVGGGPGVPVQPEQDAHGQLLRTSAKRLYDENQDLLAQNKVRKTVR